VTDEADLGDYRDPRYDAQERLFYLLLNVRQCEDLASGCCPRSVVTQARFALDEMSVPNGNAQKPLESEQRKKKAAK
jgi:hypothetical protein